MKSIHDKLVRFRGRMSRDMYRGLGAMSVIRLRILFLRRIPTYTAYHDLWKEE